MAREIRDRGLVAGRNIQRATALVFPSLPDYSWRDDAACLGSDPMLFVEGEDERRPTQRDDRRALAFALCGHCPVIKACLDDAIKNNDHEVIRGGQIMVKKGRR